MKFTAKQSDKIESGLLTYLPDECSFYMEPAIYKVDIELILNKLSLAVTDNIVGHVSGFCGLDSSMKSNYEVPNYTKGILKVEHNLKHGFAYGINHEDLPFNVNTKTGWVCIGNPEKKGHAVEFINNCVAVIDDDGGFICLWLTPPSLPKL